MQTFRTEEVYFPIKNEVMFTDRAGNPNRRMEKNQKKLLSKIDFLKPFLVNDEKILFVTTGCSPFSGLEMFFTGAIIYNLKLCFLIFTNKRIIHVPTTTRYGYRNSISQILYSDINNISIKGSELRVEYKSGLKEKFLRLPFTYRKKIKSILEMLSLDGNSSGNRQRTHLCPKCGKELKTDVFECSNCHLEFKNKAEGKRISIIYPGGGYFYTGHPFMGTLDAITEFALIVSFIGTFIGLIRGFEESLFLFITFGILLVIEKAFSVYHSNQFLSEFIPKKKKIDANVV